MSSISVIIPAYNAEKFIGEAIESALNQTRPAKEIVVVDDASTDRTVEIARSFGDRVKVLVNKVNSGPGASRDRGAQAAAGDSLAFLDADDYWLPTHLDTLAQLLEGFPEVALAVSRAELTGSRTGVWPDHLPMEDKQPTDFFLTFMRMTFSHPTAWLVRRAVWAKVGGFKEIKEYYKGKRIQAEDYYFLLRIAHKHLICGTSDVTYRYRWHDQQSSAVGISQLIMVFKYRMAMLETMGTTDPRYALAVDRMVRHWECKLEEQWVRRNSTALRLLVRYGLENPLLANATFPYRTKARLPSGVVAVRDMAVKVFK